jgi:hypothetical protein
MRDDTCRTRYCYCCLPQGATYGTSQQHACLSYYIVCNFICPMKFKRAITNRPSTCSKKGENFHIYSVCGRSLCSNSIGFKYFRIGTFWQTFSYDTNHLSLSLICHLYFRFCVHRKIQQNQKNSYMKNELRSWRLTTPTDIIRGTHLHQRCYEDFRIALDDFPVSLCTILGYYFGAYVAKSPPYCDINLFRVLESEIYSRRAVFNVGSSSWHVSTEELKLFLYKNNSNRHTLPYSKLKDYRPVVWCFH